MKKQKQNIFFLLTRGAVCTLFFLAFAGSMPVYAAEDAEDIESDISALEKKLKKETQDLNALQQDLNQINSSLTSTQQLILRVQSLLSQTEQTIGQKEKEIANLEQQLGLERRVLKGLIQEMYFTGDIPLVGVVLAEYDLLGLFQGNDNLFSTQEKMQEVIRGITEVRTKVLDEKSALEETKKDHAQLLAIQNRQKQALVSEKIDTEDDLEEQQATIAELQSKLNELKGDLNKLLGKSYDAKNIKDAIKFAASKTGIREGFLFGMLSVESRLGASVGGCDYKQSRMSAYRLGIFKSIAKELDYDYKKLKVSCPPKS
ncbi:MAG: hypothetical protein WAW00_01745, partial [Candidatus Moraniibacteriota bacterium]